MPTGRVRLYTATLCPQPLMSLPRAGVTQHNGGTLHETAASMRSPTRPSIASPAAAHRHLRMAERAASLGFSRIRIFWTRLRHSNDGIFRSSSRVRVISSVSINSSIQSNPVLICPPFISTRRSAFPGVPGLVARREGGVHCRARWVQPLAAVDYAPSGADDGVLQRPLKEELSPAEMVNVFGYPRDLRRKFDIKGVLGAGSFGVVREAVDRITGRKYACKTIPKVPKRGKPTPRYLLKLQQEVDAMQQLGASFDAVYLKDVFEDDGNIHMVMEVCTGGSILDQVKNGKIMSEVDVANILRSVLRFIAQCHTKGIIYRDVKPDNFLFLTPDASSVKATDFGLSIRHWPGEANIRSRSGTPVYMAPEVVLQEYNQQADMWSVGILMWQLLTGGFPFWDDITDLTLEQVWHAILSQQIDFEAAELEHVSVAAKELLIGLLDRNPASRLTPKQALIHPWIKDKGVASQLPLEGSVVQRLQRYGTYGRLKQVVLSMIANDLAEHEADTASTLQQLREMFNSMDENESGGLSSAELTAGLRDQGYEVSEAEFERLVDRLDLNADGCINFDEFAAGLLDWEKLKEDSLWAEWTDVAFEKLDSNGDGYISLDEIMSTMPTSDSDDESNAHLVAVSQAKRTMREADVNGDGRISREEFHLLLGGSPVPDSLDQYDARVLVLEG